MKGKKRIIVFENKLYAISVDDRQYIVEIKRTAIVWYYACLADALEDIADHFTRRQLSKRTRRSLKTLSKDIRDIREEFWKMMKPLEIKEGKYA